MQYHTGEVSTAVVFLHEGGVLSDDNTHAVSDPELSTALNWVPALFGFCAL